MSESATVENPAPSAADVVAEMNDTAGANATGTKIPATPEGMAVAYGSLVIMALIPVRKYCTHFVVIVENLFLEILQSAS